jgi:Ser-tRNA(Ala) deacylase AlaX
MTGTRKDYWQDPYQTAFQARVTKVTSNGIILDHTSFYPASGNQASDKGVLVIGGKKYDVQEVSKDGEEILHMVKPSAMNAAAGGMLAEGTIDWERRHQIMRGHTAQHVLSAYLLAHFNSPTVDASIQPDAVSISVKNSVSLNQLEEALASVNGACTTSHPVLTSILPRERAIGEFAGRIRGEISSEDPVRIVEIKCLDIMCCGGTHVKDTAEIGPLLVTKFKGEREIKFVVGTEAMVVLAKMNAGMISAAATLNKDILQLPDAVEKQAKNVKALDEQADQLSIALLEQEMKSPGLQTSGGLSIHVLKGITNKKIMTAWFNNFPPKSILVVHGSQGNLQVYSNADTTKANELVQALVAKFGGKGGGNPKIAQGMLEMDPGDIGALFKEILGGK